MLFVILTVEKDTNKRAVHFRIDTMARYSYPSGLLWAGGASSIRGH